MTRQTKLVLATDYSASGHLKHARIGTRHEACSPLLVWGALPNGDVYFAGRSALSEAEQNEDAIDNFHWLIASSSCISSDYWPGLRELAAQNDQVELWVDPDPNSQLVLSFLLDHLSGDEEILAKTSFYQSPIRLGGVTAEVTLANPPRLRPIGPADVVLASQVWNAYTAPTPEAVVSLLQAELSPFPSLRTALLDLLDELPGLRDGLGATQRTLLRMIAEGAGTPHDLLGGLARTRQPPTFGHWQIGAIIDGLADCAQPALTGLECGPFSLESHNDRERHRRYIQSRISLTDFGQGLLEGQADFAQKNCIDRWWGGTALCNEALWRWDNERHEVVKSAR